MRRAVSQLTGIYWLASYPKSGNTWVRAWLSSYRNGGGEVDLNHLDGGPIAGARELFDSWAGVSASDLLPAEVDMLRPDLYRWRAKQNSGPLIIKTHDAWTCRPDGQPLFPTDVSLGVIYVVRHPADVAASFASHAGAVVSDAVDWMCRDDVVLFGQSDRVTEQLPQRLLSWSRHVSSWLDQRDVPVLLVRFEDMLTNPVGSLTAILRFLQWDVEPGRVVATTEACDFKRLERQERDTGFKERPVQSTAPFFRDGTAGRGRLALTAAQWLRLSSEHRAMIRRLGYEDSE